MSAVAAHGLICSLCFKVVSNLEVCSVLLDKQHGFAVDLAHQMRNRTNWRSVH